MSRRDLADEQSTGRGLVVPRSCSAGSGTGPPLPLAASGSASNSTSADFACSGRLLQARARWQRPSLEVSDRKKAGSGYILRGFSSLALDAVDVSTAGRVTEEVEPA